MQNSVNSISEIKNISGRRSIRAEEEISSRKNLNNNEDRSISEPPQGYSSYINHHHGVTRTSSRLKPIREKVNSNEEQGSSDDDDDDLSKSNSQLNESDLDIPDSVSQTPTPTPLGGGISRRINSETNLNDSKRRMTGFMGNSSKRFCASTSELSFTSHLDTRKSLFSPKNNTSRALSRSSLFGSSNSLNSTNSRLFMINSPFYSGKTMFGGAAAYPKKDINQAKVLRTPIQMRPSSSLSNSSVTSTKSDSVLPESNAAKRILEVMTQFSGPLKEARSMGNNISSMIKLPGLVQNRKRFGEEELNLDRSVSLSRPAAPYGRPLGSTQNRSDSPLSTIAAAITNSKPLQVPTMSQLLQMKRLTNNTERVREIANRSESFLNQTHDYKLPDDTTSASASLKMKSNITKNLLRNDKGIDQMPPAPLNLPNIQLPELKSIPKFDIQLPVTSSSPPSSIISKSSPSPISSNAPIITSFKTSIPTAKIADDLMNGSEFKFAKPTILSSDFDTKNLVAVSDRFTFSKPLSIDTVSSLAKVVVNDNTLSQKQTETSSSSLPADNLFKNLVAQQKSQWECDSCLARNDSESIKCLCCDAQRPDSGISSKSSSFESASSPAPSKPATPIVADDLFKSLAAKQKTSQWECDVCMCKNDLDKEKCLSCESPKPGSKKVSSSSSSLLSGSNTSGFKFGMPSVNDTSSSVPVSQPPPVASDDLFKTLAAQQKKTQWECDTCMSRNDMSSEKCVACETPKPGSKPAPEKASSSFSFGMPAASQNFSFGMPAVNSSTSSPSTETKKTTDVGFQKIVDKQKTLWECSVCMNKNEILLPNCACCEHPRPSYEKQPEFLFGSSKRKGIELPKPTEVKFTFGVQPTTVSNDKKEEDQVDKPKETFSFGATTSESTPTFTFKTPATQSNVSASFTIKSPSAAEEEGRSSPKASILSFGSKINKAPKRVSFQDEKEEEKEPEKETTEQPTAFSAPGFKFGGEVAKPEEEKKSQPGGFTFGSSADLNKAPATTSSTAITSTFTFGAQKTESPVSKPTFGGFGTSTVTTTAPPSFGSIASDSKPAFSFGAAKKDETVTSPASKGFSFGSTENKPAVPSSGGFSFSSPSNATFGSTQNVAKTTTTSSISQPTNNFVFGQAKSDQEKPTFGGFGSAQQQQPKTTQAPPVFGQSSAPSFSFGGIAKEQQAPASQPSMFAFGGNKTAAVTTTLNAPASQSNMIFGSNAASSTPNLTPVFGSNATPTFGSNIAANNNNNESGFGSKMVNFGSSTIPSSNQPQKRAFDFGSAQPEVPSKKFEFGSQITPQSNAPTFQFNAQQQQQQPPADAARPAFNFNATAPPAFNFTTNATVNNATPQENLFQFGANNSSAPQGLFAFGTNAQPPQSAPVMQFGATAPSIAIPGINAFGAQSSSAASAQSRKILRAARRTNLTRR